MENKIINDRFIIQRKIGDGSFSEIYSALDKKLKIKVAIKLEKIINGKSQREKLLMEYSVYEILKKKSDTNNAIGFVHCFGLEQIKHSNDDRIFLVMEPLYKNLQQLFVLSNRRFPLKTIIFIALECLNRIETLHENYFIYRDVKPENFMIGFPGMSSFSSVRTINLIDFGLCKQYRDPYTGEHIEQSQRKSPTGTIWFMSANAHFNYEQSRRDDLESLAYMLLYFFTNQLPWWPYDEVFHYNDNELPSPIYQTKQQFQMIGSMKQALTPDQLFHGCPREFAEFLKYVQNLEFEQKPDYEMIRESFFKNLIPNWDPNDDEIFIWEHNPDFYNDILIMNNSCN